MAADACSSLECRLELADSGEISRACAALPGPVISGLVTIQAHCVMVLDEELPPKARDIIACISQNVLEIANALKAREAAR